jgi:hypothetical protein
MIVDVQKSIIELKNRPYCAEHNVQFIPMIDDEFVHNPRLQNPDDAFESRDFEMTVSELSMSVDSVSEQAEKYIKKKSLDWIS